MCGGGSLNELSNLPKQYCRCAEKNRTPETQVIGKLFLYSVALEVKMSGPLERGNKRQNPTGPCC